MKRTDFAIISKKYGAMKQNPRLTEATLFLHQAISANKSSYTFDPLENAQQAADESRLNINDEFVITDIGVFLYGKVETADVTPIETKALLTALPMELIAPATSIKAGNIWGGILSIDVNNIKYVEKYDTRKFNKAEAGRFNVYGNTGFDFAKDIVEPLNPMVTLSGAKKNQITLSLPDSLQSFTYQVVGVGQTMTYTIDRVALIMRGLNAQNAAKFQGLR